MCVMTFEHMLRTWIARKAAEEQVRSAIPTIREPTLEERILENPRDPTAKLVYADWLAERGDPRGEFVASSVLGRTDPRAWGRADRLRHEYGPGWLWPLGAPEDPLRLEVTWVDGFVEEARLWTLDEARALSAHILRLVSLPVALTLSRLSIELGPTSINAGFAVAGLAACRRLHGLDLQLPGMGAEDVMAAAELDRLRELSIDVAGLDPGALRPLMGRTAPLDRLTLDRVPFGDDLVDRLATSDVVLRLGELRLGGPLSEGSVPGLVAIATRGRPTRLVVPGLPAAGLEALSARLGEPSR